MRTTISLLIMAAVIIVAGCAAQKAATGKPSVPAGTDAPQAPAFDPLVMDTGDEGISFTPPEQPATGQTAALSEDKYVVVHVDKAAWEEEKKKALSLAEDGEHDLGYRVQVTTTTILDTALALKDSIAARFTLNVYLQHDAPYYKIRVGDYTDAEAAREIAERIKSYGYKEAWAVRSEICRSCAARLAGTTEILAPEPDSSAAEGPQKAQE